MSDLKTKTFVQVYPCMQMKWASSKMNEPKIFVGEEKKHNKHSMVHGGSVSAPNFGSGTTTTTTKPIWVGLSNWQVQLLILWHVSWNFCVLCGNYCDLNCCLLISKATMLHYFKQPYSDTHNLVIPWFHKGNNVLQLWKTKDGLLMASYSECH